MSDTPIDEAIDMKKKGLKKPDIAKDLKNKGFEPGQVSDAMNQLDIKSQFDDPSLSKMQPSVMDSDIPIPEPPKEEVNVASPSSPGQPPQTSQRPIQSQVYPNYQASQEELIESIVDEKWQQMIDTVGDIEIWKSRLNDELTAIKQEILRLSGRLDNLQKSVIGKVGEYNQNITDVETEIKALEKVMKNILQPLTSNIKELGRLTKEFKEVKS